MPKNIKIYAIILIVLLCINALVYRDLDTEADEKYNLLKSLYQRKNDAAFLYVMKHTSSALPFTETLETISKTKEDEVPAKVQQLIEKAKIQAEEFDEQLLTLIEFSDDYSNNTDPKLSVNNSVMTSDEQQDMFVLAFKARTWRPIYNISYAYWKSKPKRIDDRTRKTLLTLAKELRALNKTITPFKERASSMDSEIYVAQSKAVLLQQLKPHLEKLEKIQDEFRGSK